MGGGIQKDSADAEKLKILKSVLEGNNYNIYELKTMRKDKNIEGETLLVLSTSNSVIYLKFMIQE